MDNETNKIWNEFGKELLNYIKTKVKDPYEAEDILQEAFIKIYRNIEQLDDESKLKPWLYKITKNAIVDHYRKLKNSPTLLENPDAIMENEENENMNDEMVECLRVFLYQLPSKYQEPLEMYELKSMKHAEISQELDISVSNSKMRIMRAREKLKDLLVECCEVEFDAYGNIVEYSQRENIQCCDNNCK